MADDNETGSEESTDDNSDEKNAFEELGEKYSDVAGYKDIYTKYTDNGVVRPIVLTHELEGIVNSIMGEVGVSEEDRPPIFEYMHTPEGKSKVFSQYVALGKKKAFERFEDYARGNLDEIVESTDDRLLISVFLPEAIKKKKGDKEYDEVGGLLDFVNKGSENLKKFKEDPEGCKELVAGIAENLKTHYKAEYTDKDLLEVLEGMAEGVAIYKLQDDVIKKRKALDEKLDGKLKDYVMSLGEDKLVEIYANLYESVRQQARQGNGQAA